MNGSNNTLTAICAGVLALSVTIQADGISRAGRLVTSPELSGLRNRSSRIVTTPEGPASTLRIKNVRFEAAPPSAPKPSAVLKFDILNDGSLRLTDVIVEIAILEREPFHNEAIAPRVMVGPFTIRGDVIIESGYTVNYEMLLRNFTADCKCVATVGIVSAHAVADSGS